MIDIGAITLVLGNTLLYATPLIFAALGGLITEKSGVVNIGLEGMMTIGAFVGAAVGVLTLNPWLAFLCAGLAGGILAFVHGLISITFGGDQIVSGIGINFLGPGLALFLSRLFFSGATQTPPIDLAHKLPIVFSGLNKISPVLGNIFTQNITIYIAFVLVVLIWIFLYKTKYGLRLTAVGEHPKAAETLNINVFRIRYLAVIASGFLAGLGGASMSLAVVSSFQATLISGQGFIALVALIFGKWKPHGLFGACLFFGFAQALAIFLGGPANIKVSSHILAMIPYVSTLLILLLFVGRSTGPAAAGKAHMKEDISA